MLVLNKRVLLGRLSDISVYVQKEERDGGTKLQKFIIMQHVYSAPYSKQLQIQYKRLNL